MDEEDFRAKEKKDVFDFWDGCVVVVVLILYLDGSDVDFVSVFVLRVVDGIFELSLFFFERLRRDSSSTGLL